MLFNPCFGTPTVGVLNNRGLPVRTLTYNRCSASEPLDERVERTTYGAAGFATARVDPRLFAAGATPNFQHGSSLAGRALRTDSVDAGTRWALADLAGRPVWSRDARGTVTTWTYDTLGRPLTVQEQGDTEPAPATRDVFCYGEAETSPQDRNLRGQCMRRYDTAGRLAFASFSLAGAPLSESRQLLADAGQDADWAGSDQQAWVAQLETLAYTTAWAYDAVGDWLTQTDAAGNQQQRELDVAGRLAGSRLTLAGGASQAILSTIGYSAAGQVLSETAGNSVVTAYAYEPDTQRLVQLKTTRPAQSGRPTVLQDLAYTYDPVGNVLSVRDDAHSTTYWRNQKVEPEQTYTYDALYQLISATGRETASRGQQGQTLPSPVVPLPTDDTVYTNYTRAYAYDRGGNLTQIRHSAPASGNRYTTEITVSDRSNRAVLARNGLTPDQVDALFEAAGHQGALLPGQPLDWNRRGELRQVTPVRRDGQMDDREWYRYGSDGMRVLKVSEQQCANTTQVQRVLYLPGLECRTSRTGDTETESLQVIRLDAAGRAAVRLLHWANGQPAGIDNDSLRYSYGDVIGSSLLELDAQAEICSLEAYYPYGGTAIWTSRSAIEADYKTVRYSGKERDATGLYYYGFRYYQPWIGRWLSADPAGTVDGLNLFRMVRNNPVNFDDGNGLLTEEEEQAGNKLLWNIRYKRARNAFSRMETNGALLRNNIATKTPILSFFAPMLPAFGEKQSIFRRAISNSKIAMQKDHLQTDEEKIFLSRFCNLDFYLTHATKNNLLNEAGDLNIFSRKRLIEKGIEFPSNNSAEEDIYGLGNDDYAFFSLEVGPNLSKKSSRFGSTFHKVSYAHPAFEHSSMVLLDQLTLEIPTPKIKGLSVDGAAILKKRSYSNLDILFHGRDNSIISLGHHIIRASRSLPESDRSIVLGTKTDKEMNQVINTLFRPEIRVPGMLGVRRENIYTFRFGH